MPVYGNDNYVLQWRQKGWGSAPPQWYTIFCVAEPTDLDADFPLFHIPIAQSNITKRSQAIMPCT